MPIQVTLTLDSGAFLTNEAAAGFLKSEVGYFRPHIVIHGDGEEIKEILPSQVGSDNYTVFVRQFDKTGNDGPAGITLADSLVNHLLRMRGLHGKIVPVDRKRFHCIFDFNSGHFTGSLRKTREFQEMSGSTHLATPNRQTVEQIAHNVCVHWVLGTGESLRLTMDGKPLWDSATYRKVKKRFDIEVMADNSTAVMVYRDALVLNGDNYWMPNPGDPPPAWNHDGAGGRP